MAKSGGSESTLVYSTGKGRMCAGCGKAQSECVCSQQNNSAKGDGIVRVGFETKGRKGKGVTIISGIALGHDGLRKLASQLKQRCGSGGTVKNGCIEIQGDHRDVLAAVLQKQGMRIARTGG